MAVTYHGSNEGDDFPLDAPVYTVDSVTKWCAAILASFIAIGFALVCFIAIIAWPAK